MLQQLFVLLLLLFLCASALSPNDKENKNLSLVDTSLRIELKNSSIVLFPIANTCLGKEGGEAYAHVVETNSSSRRSDREKNKFKCGSAYRSEYKEAKTRTRHIHNNNNNNNNNNNRDSETNANNLTMTEVRMGYRPCRRSQTGNEGDDTWHKRLAFVFTLGGYRPDTGRAREYGSLNRLLLVWDSWVDFFFPQVSSSTSLVFLFDEKDYLDVMRQQQDAHNAAHADDPSASSARPPFVFTKAMYLDLIVERHLGASRVNNIHIARGDASSSGEKKSDSPSHSLDDLDQGYLVYQLDLQPSLHPLIIFATVYTFEKPMWSKSPLTPNDHEEDQLYRTWTPSHFRNANYAYVKYTNWYSKMNNELQLLEYFDYAGKFDLDLRFVQKFPHTNIASLMDGQRKTIMAPGPPAPDFEPATIGVSDCVNDFVEFESDKTKKAWEHTCASASASSANTNSSATSSSSSSASLLRFVPNGKPVSSSAASFDIGWDSKFKTCVSGHMIITWLGLYASKEVSDLSRFWHAYGNGMWHHRWTDNQWWLVPVALFSSRSPNEDLLIETDSQNYTSSANSLYSEDFVFFQGPIFNAANGSTRQSRREKTAYVTLHLDDMMAEADKEINKMKAQQQPKQQQPKPKPQQPPPPQKSGSKVVYLPHVPQKHIITRTTTRVGL